MRRLACGVMFAMSLGGCYSWHAIKPTELPKLNGGSTTITNAGGRQVALITVAKVETEDGRLVELKGASDARVWVRGAAPTLFEHPESVVQGSSLLIRSLNQTQTRIPLTSIQKVEVSQYDLVRSSFAYAIPGLVVLAIVVATTL